MDESGREWFVEQLALTAEADGFPRIAGRVWGFLLLSEHPCSLDDIARELRVSKASVSTDARRLLQHGVIERVGKAGDRRDYYRIAPDFFGRLMAYRLSRWAGLHVLVGTACHRLARLSPVVRERLDYLDTVHDFMFERVRTALVEWERMQERGGPPPRRDGGDTAPDRS